MAELGVLTQAHTQQLVECIDLHELNASRRKNIITRHAGKGVLQHAVGAVVTVAGGVGDEATLAVE